MTRIQMTEELKSLESALLNYAYKLTNDLNLAQDYLQETSYKAIKYAHTCEPGTNTLAWLGTILRNQFINDYRKKKRRTIIQNDQNTGFLFDYTKETVKNDGEKNMLYADLIELVNKLDDNFRIPFLMNYEGYKYEEIADRLELPLGTIKSRIFFARKKIQKELKRLYGVNAKRELMVA